jgi:hypothetical protein
VRGAKRRSLSFSVDLSCSVDGVRSGAAMTVSIEAVSVPDCSRVGHFDA